MPTSPGESVLAGTQDVPPIARVASDADDIDTPDAAARDKPHRRPRRPFGDMVLHAPQTLRALVRTDELWLVVLAAFIGCGSGILVWMMNETTQLIHEALFGLTSTQRLSAMVELNPVVTVVVPCLGGLALGLVGLLIARWWPRPVVDPIEANALYGGRMSFSASLLVVLQTVMSNGVGASVGLEAGYTQIGAALGSRIGRSFRVRRNDLRVLVGCGAAAAIGGAFNAPLTGAFYAFELVIGTYSLATLAPVAVASMVAVGVVHGLSSDPFELELMIPPRIDTIDYVPILGLGMLCALIGIAIMRGVTLTEQMFRQSGVPGWLRPTIGGAAIGTLALVSPMVLSSGHGALEPVITTPYPLTHIGLLIVLKATASAISIGSGFRGGLFFASLFLGAMVGKFFAGAFAAAGAAYALSPVICALVGMSAMAVAVVGGPLTMGFLALESTGSLPLTIAVLAACVVSSITVRRTFGYSFATWRFHLRGEAIRSAVDIGWMRTLTVGRMMRREVRTVRSTTPLAAFRRDFPLGATQRVIALGENDAYAGIVLTAEAHAEDAGARTVADVVHYADAVLLPQMSVKEAISMFEQSESDALAVVDAPETSRVIGLLTEHYALRRYSEELDRRRRELSGE
jgi:CIC family chloride channel protein